MTALAAPTATTFTRAQFADAVLDRNPALNGRAEITINRQTFTGRINAALGSDPAVWFILDPGQSYFGANLITVFSTAFNNYTPHVLQSVTIY